jgi:hypothetical protein
MNQEIPDESRRQVIDGETINGLTHFLSGERQEQRQAVPVAGLRVAAKIALADEMLQEEPANPDAQQSSIRHG